MNPPVDSHLGTTPEVTQGDTLASSSHLCQRKAVLWCAFKNTTNNRVRASICTAPRRCSLLLPVYLLVVGSLFGCRNLCVYARGPRSARLCSGLSLPPLGGAGRRAFRLQKSPRAQPGLPRPFGAGTHCHRSSTESILTTIDKHQWLCTITRIAALPNTCNAVL